MKISVTDPIAPAWNHMVRILFKPFELKKWFVLGFCAFLATCGEGGGGGNYWGNSTNANPFEEAKTWIEANLNLFITWAIIVISVFIIIGIFITWISSRGKFMFLDGIVKNRGAIKEPWSEYKREGNSLFLFSVVIGLLNLLCILLIGGIAVLIALPDFKSHSFGSSGVTAIVVSGFFLLLFIIASIAIAYFVRVFLVPTMYLKRLRAIEGCGVAWNQFCRGHIGSALLFLLMLILLGMAASVAGMLAICLTCCIGMLPYLSSVLLLPITVFFACYVLMYLQQFGGEWTFFKDMCQKCHYDLQGLENGVNCPECGSSLEK